ncbi:MAG: polysaccharide biosynthesis/export family protein [Planctomycetaceae bacterium]|nr:polysaccharide biosynthesis/export family protein [Planctomycetaceae bacterium]
MSDHFCKNNCDKRIDVVEEYIRMNIQSINQTTAMSVFEMKRHICLWIGLLLVVALNGCAAFHPVNGVPAAYVPDEYLGPSRSGKKTINLSLLEQRRPDQYRLAAGDVLAVYVPGVLGSLSVSEQKTVGETPPINLPQNAVDLPTIGYPVAVRDDGTISLPLVPPINVDGKTLAEAENDVRQAYTVDAKLLNDERDRVLISLSRRREYSVLVVRQETANEVAVGGQPGTVNIGKSKRGTAKVVRLPAYENDVLHALAKAEGGADGLPGLDAKNTIYIIRRRGGRDTSCSVGEEKTIEWPTTNSMPLMTQPAPTMGPSVAEPISPTELALPLPAPSLDESPAMPVREREVPLSVPQTNPDYYPIRPRGDRSLLTPEELPDSTSQTPEPAGLSEPKPGLRPQAVQPAPTGQTPVPEQPFQPEHQRSVPQPQMPQSPIWPQPANPSESLRRTSSAPPAVWGHTSKPIVRGQSPSGWSLGHSEYPGSAANLVDSSNAYAYATGQSMSVPQQPYAPTSVQTMVGHGSMPQAQPGWSPDVQSTIPPVAIGAIPSEWELSNAENSEGDWQDQLYGFDPTVDSQNVIKIPIRLSDGERPAFTEKDIILEDGDIVFIESRETEVFYTGGLLGGGQFTLPRDYDLRIIEAISIAQSARSTQSGTTRSIGGVSALNMDVTFSASHVVVLRKLPNGTRMPIKVDLYKAVRRPESENIIIQPGDMLILQYTKVEAVCALIERHLIEGALFGIAGAQLQNNGNGN